MYIINPTQEQLNMWFCCKRKVGEYLVNQCKAKLIHRSSDGQFYYFVKTKDFEIQYKKVPLWMKFFDNLGNKLYKI
jgi:hypothetical protein